MRSAPPGMDASFVGPHSRAPEVRRRCSGKHGQPQWLNKCERVRSRQRSSVDRRPMGRDERRWFHRRCRHCGPDPENDDHYTGPDDERLQPA